MILHEFLPREYVKGKFGRLRDYTLAHGAASLNVDLEFSSVNEMRVFAYLKSNQNGERRYGIVVTTRLLDYVTRLFFAFARCVPDINGVAIATPQSSGVTQFDATLELALTGC